MKEKVTSIFNFNFNISKFQTLFFLKERGHQQQRLGEEELDMEGPKDVIGEGTLWERGEDRQEGRA